jgi:hypothetical protein
MKILLPVAVTDSILTSSTIAENDAPVWGSATAYTTGQEVIRTQTHRIYRALRDNTNKTPESSPLDWQEIAPTNRWAMFDEKVGTISTATTSMAVVLTPGLISAIGFVGVDATEVRVQMVDATYGTVFDRTYSMTNAVSESSWWSYYYEPRTRKTTLIVDKLPTSRNPTVTITISAPTGQTVSIGSLLLGKLYTYANAVRIGASVGIQDFSRKERDDFGNWQIVQRTWSRRANWNFILKNTEMDQFITTMASIRGKPSLFIGGPYDATVIYGFYLDTEVVIEYPYHSECSIEIEGLEET